jgi:hypothetical protein
MPDSQYTASPSELAALEAIHAHDALVDEGLSLVDRLNEILDALGLDGTFGELETMRAMIEMERSQ